MELVYPNSFVSTLCSRDYKGVGRADTWGRIIVFRKTKEQKQMDMPNENDIKTYNLYNIQDTKPVAKCFDSTLGRPYSNQGGNVVVESKKEELIYPSKGISTLMTENTAHAGRNMLYVSLKYNHQGETNMTNGNLTNEETTTNIPSQSGTYQQTSLATSPQSEYVVRRLTPVECERLQGFPDGWTDIPWKGEAHAPDGRRYKALGNSMAVPVMRWIAERIDKVSNMKLEYQVKEFEFPTEESLF